MIPILNHIISFANVANIDSYLKKWKKGGFAVAKKTVRHAPGLRNGFVYFGPEYIEFCWVEDEKLFRKGAKNYRKFIRRHPSPYGVAFESKDVAALHSRLRKGGYKVPAVYSKGPRDADKSVVWWTFQSIPLRYLPGAWTFALTYEFRRNQKGPRRMVIGKNTLYAISGLTFVTKFPQKRVLAWKKFLASNSNAVKVNRGRYRLKLGPHQLEWLTPSTYKEEYGIPYTTPQKYKSLREIALIHLLAADLKRAGAVLRRNKFKLRPDDRRLFVGPQKHDGFAFVVTEKQIQTWRKERARFGQKFIVKYT